jgi:hypothetical protein
MLEYIGSDLTSQCFSSLSLGTLYLTRFYFFQDFPRQCHHWCGKWIHLQMCAMCNAPRQQPTCCYARHCQPLHSKSKAFFLSHSVKPKLTRFWEKYSNSFAWVHLRNCFITTSHHVLFRSTNRHQIPDQATRLLRSLSRYIDNPKNYRISAKLF